MTLQNHVVPPSSKTENRPAISAQFVTITEEEAGQRIDNYLAARLKGDHLKHHHHRHTNAKKGALPLTGDAATPRKPRNVSGHVAVLPAVNTA